MPASGPVLISAFQKEEQAVEDRSPAHFYRDTPVRASLNGVQSTVIGTRGVDPSDPQLFPLERFGPSRPFVASAPPERDPGRLPRKPA